MELSDKTKKTLLKIVEPVGFNYEQINKKTIISVAEYRKILGDKKSTNEQVIKRLKYLEALCKNIIKPGIMAYVKKRTKYKTE